MIIIFICCLKFFCLNCIYIQRVNKRAYFCIILLLECFCDASLSSRGIYTGAICSSSSNNSTVICFGISIKEVPLITSR